MMSWLLRLFGRYRVLFSESRGMIPSLAVFAGYLALGIEPLALILLIRDATGSYADAGWVAAAPMFFGAGGALVQGRLIERYGPRPVLSVAIAGHVAMLAALVGGVRAHVPLVLLVVITGVQGACFPQLVATLRVIWKRLLDDSSSRETAYALVFVTFQLALIAGPLVVTVLLPVVSRSGLLVIAAVLAVCGTAGFVMVPALRDWARPERRSTGMLGAARLPALRTFLVVTTSMGFTQGVLQVCVPAFAIAHRALAASGVLLAAVAVGNLVGAFVYGGRAWRLSLPVRYLVFQSSLCLLLLGSAFASAIAVLFPLLLLAGALLAAVSVAVSALIELVVPDRDLVEAFALNVTVAMIGNAAGTLSAGTMLQSAGYTWAMSLAGLAVAITGVVFVALRGRTGVAAASRASFSQQADAVRG
jgi:MFS family permease